MIKRYSLVILMALSGCAIPAIKELQTLKPNVQFIAANASIECMYRIGVEHVSGYLGVSEPRFQWFYNHSTNSAWFRQPLTLIEITAIDGGVMISRSQTDSVAALGHGDDLLTFFRLNSCAEN